jgi:hypothetical protein
VSQICRYQSCPSADLEKAITRVLSYLKQTLSLSIKFEKMATWNTGNPFILHGLPDASFADQHDTKSSYGYLIFLNQCLVVWAARVTKTVFLSTTEVEYFAMVEVAKEMLYLMQSLQDAGFKVELPMVISCDNLPAIHLANNPMIKARTKHINIKLHWIREMVDKGYFLIRHIRTTLQTADITTKPLTKPTHEVHTNEILTRFSKNLIHEGEC